MNSTITITVNGAPREIFMSYALLRNLTSSVESVEQVPSLFNDPNKLDNFLNQIVAERDIKGNVLTEGSEFTGGLSLDDAEALLEWGQEHVLSFFARRILKAQAQVVEMNKALGVPSSTGTQD